MVKCLVRGCRNQSDLKPGERRSRPRKRFFSFPSDQARVNLWLSALRESEYFSTEHKICEDHFLPEHITPSGISPDAIPVIPLPEPILSSGHWTSPVEPIDELSDPYEVVTEIPADDDEEEEEDEDDQDYNDDSDDDYEDEEEYEDSDYAEEEPSNMNEEVEREWLARLQENLRNSKEMNHVPEKKGITPRAEDMKLGRLTRRFIDLLHLAPEGILDLNEATKQLGTRKRRVNDITNVLVGIKLITKTSKSKIQWVGPSPISCFKGQWKNKMKNELLNLKTMEESLDWLIKDCAQQLFALTDLPENAKYPYVPERLAYVTHEDVCRLAAFRDQTVVAIKAPEETKLEVPTPTEECIKIFLKGTRGPVHVLTCEPSGSDPNPLSGQLKNGHFLTLQDSRIKTTPLLTDLSTISSAVRSA